MQSGFYGSRSNGGATRLPRVSPSQEEKRLLEMLVDANERKMTTLLKCIDGWQFEGQADLNNWTKVLTKMDDILKRALDDKYGMLLMKHRRPDALRDTIKQESDTNQINEKEREDCTEQVYEILRFSSTLLENSFNKYVYKSVELVTKFLTARNEMVVFEACRVLAMFALPPHPHRHLSDCHSQFETNNKVRSFLRKRLLQMVQVLEISNSSLDLVDFITEKEGFVQSERAVYEFYTTMPLSNSSTGDAGTSTTSATANRSQLVTVNIPPFKEESNMEIESEMSSGTGSSSSSNRCSQGHVLSNGVYAVAEVCESLIEQHQIAEKHWFPLVSKIRACYSSRCRSARESFLVERLHVLLTLSYAFSDSPDVTSFVEKNPEMIRSVVELVRVEVHDCIPLKVRIAALQVLTALVHDRVGRGSGMGTLGRQANILSALGVTKGTPHGVLPSLVRFCMSELGSITKASRSVRSSIGRSLPHAANAEGSREGMTITAESDSDMDMSLAVAFVEATTDMLSPQEAEVLSTGAFRDTGSVQGMKLCWIEGVLCLLNDVVASQTGAAVLTENGVIPALLHVISTPSASPLHASLITQCIQVLETTISNNNLAATLYRDLNGVGILVDRLMMECSTVAVIPSIGSSMTNPTAGGCSLRETKAVLLLSLLVTLSISFHSQGVMSAGATSRAIREGSALSKVLLKILGNIETFGASLFAQASVVVSDIINNDPSSINHVHSTGLADAYLRTITRWDVSEFYPSQVLTCSAELVMAIPPALNALSLTTTHADRVMKCEPLVHLMDMFALPGFVEDGRSCFQGDVAAIVGAGVFELMRNVSSFQGPTIQACVASMKKVLRFGEEYVAISKSADSGKQAEAHEKYQVLLRMVTNLAELVDPMLAKSEIAVSFSDHGGVDLFLKLYEMILPNTNSFLSSAFALSDPKKALNGDDTSFSHFPTSQAITTTLRSYAAQQPTTMLTSLLKQIHVTLGVLQKAREAIGLPWVLSESSEGAEGILSSLPDYELSDLVPDKQLDKPVSNIAAPSLSKVGPVGNYLRVLANLEWLTALLVWTLDACEGHLQNRRWFSEFSSKATQQVLSRLFVVDRSVQFERARLAHHARKKAIHAQSHSNCQEDKHTDDKKKHGLGLWKVGSLLLLRFTLMMRSLLSSYGKTFIAAPQHHRRGEDGVVSLTSHAIPLANAVGATIAGHLNYVLDPSRAQHMDPFVQQYFLTFLLETMTNVLFDGKRKSVNTLLLWDFMKPRDLHGVVKSEDMEMAGENEETKVVPTSSILEVMLGLVKRFLLTQMERAPGKNVCEAIDAEQNKALSRLDANSFKIAATTLSRLADLEAITNSPMTASLAVYEKNATTTDKLGFDPRYMTVHVHLLCARTLLSMWTHARFVEMPFMDGIGYILPIIVILLKNRFDPEAKAQDGNSGRTTGSVMDTILRFTTDRSSRSTLMGESVFGSSRRDVEEFSVDETVVESLTAMGFERPRIEHAIRRIQINDVEMAMEWMLAHPEEEGEEKEDESSSLNTAQSDGERRNPKDGEKQTEGTLKTSKQEEELKNEEAELLELYKNLREQFEDGCFSILRAKALELPVPADASSMEVENKTSNSKANKDQLNCEQYVKSIASDLSFLWKRCPKERAAGMSRLMKVLVDCSCVGETALADDRVVGLLAHLFALLLRLDGEARSVFLAQEPSGSEVLLAYLEKNMLDNEGKPLVKPSFAPILLVMDSLCKQDPNSNDLSNRVRNTMELSNDGESIDQDKRELPKNASEKLLNMCITFLRAPTLHKEMAHSIWQLLARLTLRYELANTLFNRDGVDLILEIPASAVFNGYKELTTLILCQMMESPDVLEHQMMDKISKAMSKLSSRTSSQSQLRVTPRALLMEVASIAARDEDIFIKALNRVVEMKKSENGRTYVIPKSTLSSVDRERISTDTEASGAPLAGDLIPGDALTKDKTMSAVMHAQIRLPRAHKQESAVLVDKIVQKILFLWKEEQQIDNQKEILENEKPVLCVGTYMYFLVNLVSRFSSCAHVFGKSTTKDGSTKQNVSVSTFVSLVLKELLPSKELCSFAAVRKSLKEGLAMGGASAPLASEALSVMSFRIRERVRNSHKFLVGIGSQSSEGSRSIIMELISLFREWPQQFGIPRGTQVEVVDEDALSALHAWSGLIMSVLWPNGATKGFAWDKVVLSGALKEKHAFVNILAEALRRICLSHPLAHAACSILLRPLATLTRPFVAQRVNRLMKKREKQAGATDADSASGVGANDSSDTPTVAIAVPTAPTSEAEMSERAPTEPSAVEDVTMHSPHSVEDHEMQLHHEESDMSSVSSSDGEEDEEDADEHDEDDEEAEGRDDEDEEGSDDDDDEDEDPEEDDDEDDDEDEDEDYDGARFRIRRVRIGSNNSMGRRLWEAVDNDSELSIMDALDEVDENEFSYLHMLNDEVMYADDQLRRLRQSNSQSTTSTVDADADGDSVLMEGGASRRNDRAMRMGDILVLGAHGPESAIQETNVLTFFDDDEEEDDEEENQQDANGSGLTGPNGPNDSLRDMFYGSRRGGHRGLGGDSSMSNIYAVQYPEDPLDFDDFIFDSFFGNETDILSDLSRRRLGNFRDGPSTHAMEFGGVTHPMLRVSGASSGNASNMHGNDSRLSSRLALPRHSSLLREVQELRDQVATLHSRNRDLLGRLRTRPPSRNRMSTVSNLLGEFSLDLLPSSQPIVVPRTRARRLNSGVVRDFGTFRSFRANDFDAPPPSSFLDMDVQPSDTDIRSIASRLEQRILRMTGDMEGNRPRSSSDTRAIQAASRERHRAAEDEEEKRDEPSGSTNAAAQPGTPSRSEPMQVTTLNESEQTGTASCRSSTVGEDRAVLESDTTMVDANVAGEAGSETASVIALASTLGESSLRSPGADQDIESDSSPVRGQPNNNAPLSLPLAPTTAMESSTEQVGSSILPPPAPASSSQNTNQLLQFTLDFSTFATTPPRSIEEEQKTDEPLTSETAQEPTDTNSTPATFVCPDGMDPEVFNALPPDMQEELVAQSGGASVLAATTGGSESFSQFDLDMDNTSLDRETLNALPPDIRAEVLANERREREAAAARSNNEPPADISRAQEMDNASFVASLAPDLREEILVTCDDAFLQTLPSAVRAEAMVLRERAVFGGPTYSQAPEVSYERNGSGGNRESRGGDEIFRRPALRRMLTSHGMEPLRDTSSRRSSRRMLDHIGRRSRRRHGLSSNGSDTSAVRSRSHPGMIRVDPDESEDEKSRIFSDECVKGVLRLLFMSQSIIQNRVFQRLLSNICLFPVTRRNVLTNMLRIATLPLERSLLCNSRHKDKPDALENAIQQALCREGTGKIPVDVVHRILHVMLALVKYNPRFSVELLKAHGMHRGHRHGHGHTHARSHGHSHDKHEESGVSVLTELLSVAVVNRNGTNLDTLLELLEYVLSPLEYLPRKKQHHPESKALKNATEDTNSSSTGTAAGNSDQQQPNSSDPSQKAAGSTEKEEKKDESRWLEVPAVRLDSCRMADIVGVLCLDLCTNQMQQRAVTILKLLDGVPGNRKLVLQALVHHASTLVSPEKYKGMLAGQYETSAVLQSAQDELKLLRLLHTLSDVCETTEEFNECCKIINLEPLWEALSSSLEEARASGGLEEHDGKSKANSMTIVSPSNPPSAPTDEESSDGMVIEGKSAGASCAMAALLARFLPMVEAFFVVNARDAASMSLKVPNVMEREEAVVAALRTGGFQEVENREDAEKSDADPTETDETTLSSLAAARRFSESGETMRLANFVEANRVLLNILVREKSSLLDTSLAALIKIPRCRAYLDFDNKRTYFQTAMKKLRQNALRNHGGGSSSVRIPVRRDHVFEDSYYALRMRSGHELRRKLHITFTGEEGIDAGGVTREWYMILAREIFNPNYVLFTSAADSPTFQPNPLSYVNRDHLSYFEFVGKVIGKAVADGQLLDAHFTRSFYKHILQLPISYHDMEAIDPEYYRNLHSILDHPIQELGIELTFAAEQSNFGKVEVVDLIPNGRHVRVTDANKMEYVKLVTHHRMATGIRQQIDAFLKGFHQLVSPELISIFNENELELLISGMPEIDIDDLKANTEYANYKPTDQVIRWFWNVLYSFTHEERALFLQFVTGTSKVPLEGFKALEGMRGTQKFNIHKAFGNSNALPSAHTCFNQLDLPEYESEEKLKQRLLFAIREGSEGFGFG